MTVQQLREALSTLPSDAPVIGPSGRELACLALVRRVLFHKAYRDPSDYFAPPSRPADRVLCLELNFS